LSDRQRPLEGRLAEDYDETADDLEAGALPPYTRIALAFARRASHPKGARDHQ
jgi:hypothetical protein